MLKIKSLALTTAFVLLLQGLYAQYEGQVDFDPADVNTMQTDGWDLTRHGNGYWQTLFANKAPSHCHTRRQGCGKYRNPRYPAAGTYGHLQHYAHAARTNPRGT